MELRRFLVILTTALVLILIIVIWYFPSNEDFRTENPFWNGAKDIASLNPASPLTSLSDLPSPSRGTVLILIPYLDFTTTELEQLNSFVSTGGTLILADDYGFGNQVLEHLKLGARFSGQLLLDPLFNHKNKRFPRITHLTSTSVTGNTESLVFNHATCLTDIEDDNVLALSSSFSFLDLDDDQTWDWNESTGPFPVISRHNLGDGQLILISDPSIFINSMEELESNYSLIQNVAAITTSKLLIDQSHLPPSNLSQTRTILVQVRDILITPGGTLGVVVVALTITLMPIWRRKGDDIDYRKR